MRFRFGGLPEDAGFEPEKEGWTLVREPKPAKMMLIVIGPLVVAGLLLQWLYSLAGVDISPLNIRNAPYALLIMAGIMPVYELVHLVCLPRFGTDDKTTVGFWLKLFVLYVYYEGELSKARYILISAAPFLVISMIPLFVSFMRPDIPILVVAISFLNFFGCGIDLGNIFILLKEVPSGAVVKMNGHRNYWRLKIGAQRT